MDTSRVGFHTHVSEISFRMAGVHQLIHSIDGLEESPPGDQMTLPYEIPLQSNARARFTR